MYYWLFEELRHSVECTYNIFINLLLSVVICSWTLAFKILYRFYYFKRLVQYITFSICHRIVFLHLNLKLWLIDRSFLFLFLHIYKKKLACKFRGESNSPRFDSFCVYSTAVHVSWHPILSSVCRKIERACTKEHRAYRA